jgi:hypothetical protein
MDVIEVIISLQGADNQSAILDNSQSKLGSLSKEVLIKFYRLTGSAEY